MAKSAAVPLTTTRVAPSPRTREEGWGEGQTRTRLWHRLIPSWPLIVGLAALVRALAQPRALLNDPDTYLHIAAGRWMLTHLALPVHDPFSHSLAGAIWVPHEWLAEVVLASVYGAGGWSGLVLLGAACFAASMALLTRFLLRYYEPFSALIAVTLGAALVLGHLLVRPHIIALPLLVIWCGKLFAARDSGTAPPAWLLTVMLLWANLHGSFMFGLAMVLLLGMEAMLSPGRRILEARRWGLFALLAVIASLATPNGVGGFVEPFRLMMMPTLQASFSEWTSPNFQSLQPVEIWLLGGLGVHYRYQAAGPAAVAVGGALSHGAHACAARRTSRACWPAGGGSRARPADCDQDRVGTSLAIGARGRAACSVGVPTGHCACAGRRDCDQRSEGNMAHRTE